MEATREMKGKRLVCWLDIRESLNEGRRSDGPFVPAPHVAFSTKRAAAFACLVCGSQTKLLERTGTYLHLYTSPKPAEATWKKYLDVGAYVSPTGIVFTVTVTSR